MIHRGIVMALALIAGWAGPSVPSAEDAAAPDLVILYTGETRGEIEEHGCCYKMGGLARRSAAVRHYREACPRVLLVDSGDYLFPRANDPYASLRPRPIREAMAWLGYDAVNIADGELQAGTDFIPGFTSDSRINLTSANMVMGEPGQASWPPYILKKLGDITVGIIGVTGPDLIPDGVRPPGMVIHDPADALSRHLPDIRKQAHVVILLSHAGWAATLKLAARFPDIDIAVCGHEDHPVFEPEWRGGTLLVKNAIGGVLMGVIRVWMSPSGGVSRMENEVGPLSSEYALLPEDYALEETFKVNRKKQADVLLQQKETAMHEEAVKKWLQLTPEQAMEKLKSEERVISDGEILRKRQAPPNPAGQ